ncbi:hypothetical protein NHJ13734_009538 [Beauveria thailandica]
MEALFQDQANEGILESSIIHSHHAYFWSTEPAWLASSSVGVVHNIVPDQDSVLEQFDHPPKKKGFFLLFLIDGIADQNSTRVYGGKPMM